MLQLELEGFLITIPRKGTVVRPIRVDDIKGQRILREALECQAARMYCGEPVRRNLKKLKELARKAEQAEFGSIERLSCEITFHRELVGLAECPALTETFDKNMLLGHFISVNQSNSARSGQEQYSHERLVDELLAADPDQAEQLIRRHINWFRERFCTGDGGIGAS